MNKLLRISLGAVFVLAAVYKMIFFDQALLEMSVIGLPLWVSFVTIGTELIFGSMLILNIFPRFSVWMLAIFVFLAVFFAVIFNLEVLADIPALFTFQPEITDIYLHTLYLGILIWMAIFMNKK